MRAVVCALFVAFIVGTAAASSVRVQLHLQREHSEDTIEQAFRARSTPGSSDYLAHLSVDELTALVAAKPSAINAVERFFAVVDGADNARILATRDVFTATVHADTPAARALGLPAQAFRPSIKRSAVPVPAALREHVASITVVPAAIRAAKHRRAGTRRAAALSSEPGMDQTPADIRARYSVPTWPLPSSAVQGVAEFQQSYFSPSWISNFTAKYGLPKADIRVAGPNNVSSDNLEGTLDLEYITALAPEATTWWISSNDTGPDPANIDFSWWCDEVLALKPMPTVVSISWGLGEHNYYGHESILVSDNDAFRKLALVGITVFAASGDSGPGSRAFISCNHFDPGWPASSPYLTSVGATYADAANSSEVAVSWSGGGFSDYFPAPDWQKAHTAAYMAKAVNLPNRSFFNASGRGFPDVAALGTNFMVYGDSEWGVPGWMRVSGTSCASPTFAALVTRINAQRVQAGKPTLGFINPLIYQYGRVGFDVVNGTSQDTTCFGFNFGGFTASPGWDPLSGLGTPVYTLLEQILGGGAPEPTTTAAPKPPTPAPKA